MYKRKYHSGYVRSLASGVKTGIAIAKYASYARKGVKKVRKSMAPPDNAVRVTAKTYKKKYRKKRVYKKSNKVSVTKLKKDVRSLQTRARDGEAILTYRFRSTGKVTCPVNLQTFSPVTAVSILTIETILQNMLYFDPSDPSNLITANGISAGYERNYRFKSMYMKTTFKNNYQVPVKITVYLSIPRVDTNITPIQAFINGMADNPGGALSVTSPLSYVSDSSQFKKLWNIIKSQSILLQPGQEYVISHSSAGFNYDPANSDHHTSSYQKSYNSYSLDVRVEGVLGHDVTLNEVGFLQGGVDITTDRIFKLVYDAGIQLDYVRTLDTSQPFTNSGVVSSHPIADNIAYSIA